MADYRVPIKLYIFKNFLIWFKSYNSAIQLGRTNLFHRAFIFALRIFLHVLATVAVHFGFAKDRQGIDHGGAYSMQASGDFIAFPSEFSPGMQSGHNGFQSGDFGFFMYINGYPSSIIRHPHTIIRQKYNFNIIAESSHSFVARIIKNFPN